MEETTQVLGSKEVLATPGSAVKGWFELPK